MDKVDWIDIKTKEEKKRPRGDFNECVTNNSPIVGVNGNGMKLEKFKKGSYWN